MTSTPVKDVGSLLNFVGSSKPVSQGKAAEGADSFGSVMSKASQKQQDVAENTSVQEKKDVSAESKQETSPVRSKTETVKETEKPAEATKEAEVSDEVTDKLEEAGKELIGQIAEELGVTEEEILDAMEELGLSLMALFDPEALTQLVLTVSDSDSLALLTDAGLYNSLQTLLNQSSQIKEGLMESFSLSPEELDQIMAEYQMAESDAAEETVAPSIGAEAGLQTEEAETAEPVITVSVEEGADSVKLTTDEKGNVKQVETVVTNKQPEQASEESMADEHSASGEGSEQMQTMNQILQTDMQNKMASAEVSFEQAAMYLTADTQQIMDQIMDYMRIQLKPGMDQLEMQLHPETLGTVQIQITSQGGEITAQFKVTNETVKAVIESQLVELKESLKNQGVVVEAVEVSVETNAFESNLWQGQGREEEAAYQEKKKSPRRIDLSRLDEGFEEIATEEEILSAKMMEANGNTVDYTA